MERLNLKNILEKESKSNHKLILDFDTQNIVAEAIQKFKELADGDISKMKQTAEDFSNKRLSNDDFPYHDLFYSLYNYFTGNLDEAEQKLKELSSIEWPSTEIHGYIHLLRGSNLRSLGALDQAVILLNKSLEVLEPEAELEVFRGFAYYHLGGINILFDDFDKAEANLLASLESAEFTQHQTGLFRSCIGLSDLYLEIDKIKQAKSYLMRASILAHDSATQTVALNLEAIYLLKDKKFQEALSVINTCIVIRSNAGLKDALTTSYVVKSQILIELDKQKEAIEIAGSVLSDIRQYKTRIKERDCLKVLYKAHQKDDNFKVAFAYLKEFEVLNKELIHKQYKEILMHKNSFITEQRNEIFKQHQEIKSSIKYSKNLQTAILPSDEIIEGCFKNHFILYLPKDIVAGDFYWISSPEMRPADNLEEDWVLFAAADCTGHGVPGAIVSFICSDLLNRAVSEFKLIDPAKILDKVTKLIIQRFGMNNHLVTDGMDISLAAYNKKTNELRWAGANNSLILVANNTLTDIKGDRQGIGYYKNIKPFTAHSLQMNKGDVVYLGTDGYPDQFGGERGKKMSQKRYKDKLYQLHAEPPKDQEIALKKYFESWSGDEEQLDDVCIFGVKF